MKRESKECSICGIEKPLEEYNRCQRKCKGCESLSRCYVCREVKDASQFRKGLRRCNPCDNKLHVEWDKNKPTTNVDRAKWKRARDSKKERGYKAPENLNNKIIKRMRNSVKEVFKNWNKDKVQRTINMLEYSKEEFFKKFPEIPKGMDLDHKIPVSWFIIDSPISIIHHLDNLQLLSKEENCSKKNYYSHPIPQEYYDRASPHIKTEYINKLIINPL